MAIVRKELLALLTAASYMVVADGKIETSEKRVLRVLFHVAGITEDERQWMTRDTTLSDLLGEINSEDARQGLIHLMALVAGADGSYQVEERKFLRKIMSEFGISYDTFSFFDDKGSLDVKDVREHASEIIDLIKHLSDSDLEPEEKEMHVGAIISSEKFDDSTISQDDLKLNINEY